MAKKQSKKKRIPGARGTSAGAVAPGPKPIGTAGPAPRPRSIVERRRRRRRARGGGWIVAVIAVLALVGVGIAAFSGSSSSADGVTDPTKFDLPALDGNGRVRLADFRGKPLVVNFFASWCTACDAELPGFAKVSRELEGKVDFAGVNALETGDKNYMPDRHDIRWWPLASDIGGAQGSGLHDALGGGNGMPVTAFYDTHGQLLNVVRGELPEPALRQTINQLYGIAT